MTLKAIEQAIEKLPVEEASELQNWLEDYLEDQLEFTEEFAAKIEKAQKDIARGKCRIRNASAST